MQHDREPLHVVIVHWNQPEECLATIGRFRSLELPVSVTVIDNGSRPDAARRLHDGMVELGGHGGAMELVRIEDNTGFGPGANVGLDRFLADPDAGEWVALAPHDVEPAQGCLTELLEAAASEPMAGLLCADVGDGMSPVIDPYFGGMVVPAPAGDAPLPRWEDVDYPHGTLMMLRRQCLTEVGLFDERYFSYCEEADLALRARRAGWRIGLVRGARVRNVHLGSSVALVDYLQTRNTLLLVQEMSGWYHASIRAAITVLQTVSGLRRPGRRPAVFDARARMMGLRDFVLRRFGPPPDDLRH